MNRRVALHLLSMAGIGVSLTSQLLNKLIDLRTIEHREMDVPEEVSLIADMILPRTDTPGALDVGAPQFAMYMLKEISPAQDGQKFEAGLQEFRKKCDLEFGASFKSLTIVQRESLLRRLIDSEDAFFSQVHGLILVSYFTSEAGMKEALTYNPIPMRYEPCIEVTSDTRSEASYF